jgi:E3 ubiquitin-protein ligase HECTD2
MPDLAASLQYLLDYDGDVKEDFMRTFQVSINEYDVVQTFLLKPNGDQIDVTNDNRKEFVTLYVDFLLNKSIYDKFKAFYFGFHSVCASNAVIVNINYNFDFV